MFLARPLAPELGCAGALVLRDTARIAAWSAVGAGAVRGSDGVPAGSVLVETVDLRVLDVLGADFALASLVKIAAGLAISALLVARGPRAPAAALLAACAVELVAATLTTHAAARLDDRAAAAGREPAASAGGGDLDRRHPGLRLRAGPSA